MNAVGVIYNSYESRKLKHHNLIIYNPNLSKNIELEL